MEHELQDAAVPLWSVFLRLAEEVLEVRLDYKIGEIGAFKKKVLGLFKKKVDAFILRTVFPNERELRS